MCLSPGVLELPSAPSIVHWRLNMLLGQQTLPEQQTLPTLSMLVLGPSCVQRFQKAAVF